LLQRVCIELKAPTPWEGSVPKGGFVVLNMAANADTNTIVSVDKYRPIA
jgi:hypothetical protein